MRKFFFSPPGRGAAPGELAPRRRKLFRLMLAMLLLGILCGSLVGLFFSGPAIPDNLGAYVTEELLFRNLFAALLNSAQFFILLYLFSTSYFGAVLTPCLVLLRGYLLSCSISAFYVFFSDRGLLCVFLIRGIPALFLVPCFLILACDAFSASARLLRLHLGRGISPGTDLRFRHFLLAAPLVLLEALYGYYLVPELLSRIS